MLSRFSMSKTLSSVKKGLNEMLHKLFVIFLFDIHYYIYQTFLHFALGNQGLRHHHVESALGSGYGEYETAQEEDDGRVGEARHHTHRIFCIFQPHLGLTQLGALLPLMQYRLHY